MYNANTTIFHSLGLHYELIITYVLVDAISINHLTRPRNIEIGFSTGLDSLGKDIPIPLIQVSTLTYLHDFKGQPTTFLIRPHSATILTSHVWTHGSQRDLKPTLTGKKNGGANMYHS